MKKIILGSLICITVILSGCIVDVVQQSTERLSSAGGSGVTYLYFDASGYHGPFTVTANAIDSLVADGIFSLWSTGASSAASFAQNVNMIWQIDTLHHGQLLAYATGAQKELMSIDRMNVKIPPSIGIGINTTNNDVTVQNMGNDVSVTGTSSNVSVTTNGWMNVTTQSGGITGSGSSGANLRSGSGDISVTIPSRNFGAVSVVDTSGNVSIHIAAGAPVTFLLASNHGNVVLNYDGISRNAIGSAISVMVNGGGKPVNVSTATGNISVSN